MKKSKKSPQTLTGSKWLDRLVFVGIFAVMVMSGRRLLVYHRGIPAYVSVVAISGAGERTALELPETLHGIGKGIFSSERRIRSFAATEAGRELAPPGGYLEWSIQYSSNFSTVDRIHILNTGEAHDR